MFNPRVEDFLKEKPDLTIVGLYWAGYWRLAMAYFLVWAVLILFTLLVFS